MYFCCIQRCTLSEIQSLCISFLPKKRKSDFNNEFRLGTIAIATTLYPFSRFHGSQTLSFIPAAIYNRVKRVRTNVRPSPLQSVRRAFFSRWPVVLLHRKQTRPQEPYRGIQRTSVRDSSARLFPIARWERAVFLSDNLRFVRQKRSLCEAGAAPKSRPFFKLYNGY